MAAKNVKKPNKPSNRTAQARPQNVRQNPQQMPQNRSQVAPRGVQNARQNPQARNQTSQQRVQPAQQNNRQRVQTSQQRRKADQAYNKAVRERSTAPKHRKRVGNYSHYYIALGIIAVIIVIVLANTVLFNCSSIEVEGTQRYSAEEIIAASGLKTGDNLLHISTSAAEEKILSNFAYIDSVNVAKKYPTGIMISVGEAEQWFCVKQGYDTAVVSRLGKLIDKSAPASLVRVVGYEPVSMEVGETLASTVEGKQELPAKILTSAETNYMRGLTEIDITDRFNIELKLGDRIVVRIGDISELDEKLHSAVSVINNSVSDSESVYIDVRITDQVIIGNMAEQESLPEIPVQPETAEAAGE